eukprot:528277-Rhodomonas_salina.1
MQDAAVCGGNTAVYRGRTAICSGRADEWGEVQAREEVERVRREGRREGEEEREEEREEEVVLLRRKVLAAEAALEHEK